MSARLAVAWAVVGAWSKVVCRSEATAAAGPGPPLAMKGALAPFWVWAPSVARATYRYSDSCPPPPGNLTHAVCWASRTVNCPGLRAVGLTAEQSTVPGGLGSLPPQAASTTEPTSIVLGKRERITCGSGPAVRQA